MVARPAWTGGGWVGGWKGQGLSWPGRVLGAVAIAVSRRLCSQHAQWVFERQTVNEVNKNMQRVIVCIRGSGVWGPKS